MVINLDGSDANVLPTRVCNHKKYKIIKYSLFSRDADYNQTNNREDKWDDVKARSCGNYPLMRRYGTATWRKPIKKEPREILRSGR
jgi:hypothetical protein